MGFERGDRVEVLNMEEGFEGSYYSGNIICRVSKSKYIVQYRRLAEEDDSGPLREVLSTDQIRPEPREIVATDFRLWEVVDAYEQDGWWVGKIIRITGSKYLVHFESTDEKIEYPLSQLRVHQDWNRKDGVWLFSQQGSKMPMEG